MNSTVQGDLAIKSEGDIVAVRRMVREAALQIGFGLTDMTRIVTASSELARNVFKYAGSGIMRWHRMDESGRAGIEIQFIDKGPGIPDVELAMEEGYSTGKGLGLGLPGAR